MQCRVAHACMCEVTLHIHARGGTGGRRRHFWLELYRRFPTHPEFPGPVCTLPFGRPGEGRGVSHAQRNPQVEGHLACMLGRSRSIAPDDCFSFPSTLRLTVLTPLCLIAVREGMQCLYVYAYV